MSDEGPEYEVIRGGGRNTEVEFALKKCPAYISTTAPRGGFGEEEANSDEGEYETLS